ETNASACSLAPAGSGPVRDRSPGEGSVVKLPASLTHLPLAHDDVCTYRNSVHTSTLRLTLDASDPKRPSCCTEGAEDVPPESEQGRGRSAHPRHADRNGNHRSRTRHGGIPPGTRR